MNARVALVDPLSNHGGMHYYTHDLATALSGQEVDVLVLAPDSHDKLQGPFKYAACFDGAYGPESKFVRGIRLLRGYRTAIQQAKKFGAEYMIFHVFKSNLFELAGVSMARRAGIKPICIVHDVSRLDKSTKLSFLSAIAQKSAAIISHNAFSANGISQICNDFRGKLIHMPHGNYMSHFTAEMSKEQAKERLGISPTKKVFLFFGNPRREKGLDVLLEALPPLAGREDVCLLVAGKMKPEEEAIHRQYVQDHDIADIVRFDIGHVPDEMVQTYYSAADVVALPYLRVYESGVALMAASLGRPILASNLPVFAEMIDQGMGGILFDPWSESALRRNILDILTDKVNLDGLGRAALRYAVDRRDWQTVSAPVANQIRKSTSILS